MCNVWCRRDSAITVAVAQLQFVAFNDRCRGADGARHRLEVPQLLCLLQVVDSPVCGTEANPCGPGVPKTTEMPQLHYIDMVVDVPVLSQRC